MEELSVADREVLVELFYRNVALDEVAGMSLVAVKSRLDSALEALRAALDRRIADRHGPR